MGRTIPIPAWMLSLAVAVFICGRCVLGGNSARRRSRPRKNSGPATGRDASTPRARSPNGSRLGSGHPRCGREKTAARPPNSKARPHVQASGLGPTEDHRRVGCEVAEHISHHGADYIAFALDRRNWETIRRLIRERSLDAGEHPPDKKIAPTLPDDREAVGDFCAKVFGGRDR